MINHFSKIKKIAATLSLLSCVASSSAYASWIVSWAQQQSTVVDGERATHVVFSGVAARLSFVAMSAAATSELPGFEERLGAQMRCQRFEDPGERRSKVYVCGMLIFDNGQISAGAVEPQLLSDLTTAFPVTVKVAPYDETAERIEHSNTGESAHLRIGGDQAKTLYARFTASAKTDPDPLILESCYFVSVRGRSRSGFPGRPQHRMGFFVDAGGNLRGRE